MNLDPNFDFDSESDNKQIDQWTQPFENKKNSNEERCKDKESCSREKERF